MKQKIFSLLVSLMLIPVFGMVEGLAYGASSVPLGDWDFCSPSHPCSAGQGDCDSDADCQQGLTCMQDVGPTYGFAKGVDVCVGNAASSNGSNGSPASSTGSSSSKRLLDLLSGLSDSSTQPSGSPSSNTTTPNWECHYNKGDTMYCVVCRPKKEDGSGGCLEGEGWCNNSSQCAAGLHCVNHVCVKP